jgi:DNA repair exonuclease SbcCD ATPase subunit
MNGPGGFGFPPPPPSQYARPDGMDDPKRRRLEDGGPYSAVQPPLGYGGLAAPSMPPQYLVPGVPGPAPMAQDPHAVSRLRSDLELLRGHVSALRQENASLKEDGATVEARFQEHYKALREENERCRADFQSLKGQLESSSTELAATTERMERSRTDVEAAVAGYRSEAKDYVTAPAVERVREDLQAAVAQAQAEARRDVDTLVALAEGRLAEVRREAEAAVSAGRAQAEAALSQLLEDRAVALERDVAALLSGEDPDPERRAAQLVAEGDGDGGGPVHLGPIRKDIQALLTDRLAAIKSELTDRCAEQLEARRREVADQLRDLRDEIRRMEALQEDLETLGSVRDRAGELDEMRRDLDALLADRARLLTPDAVALALEQARTQLGGLPVAVEALRGEGEAAVRECRQRMKDLTAEWMAEERKQVEALKETVAKQNKEWCDKFMGRLAQESYENLQKWGESLRRGAVGKQEECLAHCKAAHRAWMEEYRAELSAFKQDVVRSNRAWGQDYMAQVAVMAEQRLAAAVAGAPPPAPSPAPPALWPPAAAPPPVPNTLPPPSFPPPPPLPSPGLYGVGPPMGAPPAPRW